jgi:hypothetical protein
MTCEILKVGFELKLEHEHGKRPQSFAWHVTVNSCFAVVT